MQSASSVVATAEVLEEFSSEPLVVTLRALLGEVSPVGSTGFLNAYFFSALPFNASKLKRRRPKMMFVAITTLDNLLANEFGEFSIWICLP